MYNLPYFKENDPAVVLRFMREHPFVLLTGVDQHGKPVATQVPVFIDEHEGRLFISGHLMRHSDHHKAFEKNPDVLALFTGPNTYVSASWYDNPHMGSTWNYITVHARGRIRFGEEEEVIKILQRLSLHYEKGNQESPTVYQNLPGSYTEKMLKGIVAFDIELTSLDNVFKLSQNRDAKSFSNIIEQLNKQEGDARVIAAEMEKRKSTLFPA